MDGFEKSRTALCQPTRGWEQRIAYVGMYQGICCAFSIDRAAKSAYVALATWRNYIVLWSPEIDPDEDDETILEAVTKQLTSRGGIKSLDDTVTKVLAAYNSGKLILDDDYVESLKLDLDMKK